VAGLSALQVPWPNEQRCLLALVGVGLAGFLQGASNTVQYLRGRWPQPPAGAVLAQPWEPAASAREPLDRSLVRFIRWIFGAIGHVQIGSPAFDQRIRLRYQSEIGELTGLGFAYLYSDGETFSLFRLLLLLPAIIVFDKWRNRQPLTVHRGTKILAGYPVLVSKDETTYANPNGHGVKFLTAFQDGTLLASGSYADDTTRGPMVVKHSRTASIGDTWAGHRERIQELEAEGKQVVRQVGYQAFTEMAPKETAAW